LQRRAEGNAADLNFMKDQSEKRFHGDACCDAGAGLELLPAKSQRHREAKKTPLGFFALKNGRKNRAEFRVFCQWDVKSSRS
jgi:hypothetical protein